MNVKEWLEQCAKDFRRMEWSGMAEMHEKTLSHIAELEAALSRVLMDLESIKRQNDVNVQVAESERPKGSPLPCAWEWRCQHITDLARSAISITRAALGKDKA